MLTADERFLFNKLFLKVKKNYLDVYGFDNRQVSNQDVVDFINAIASRPAQGTTADDVIKSIVEEDKKKTGRLRADEEGAAMPKLGAEEPEITLGTPVVPEAAAEPDVQAAEAIKGIGGELLRQFARDNGVSFPKQSRNIDIITAINSAGFVIPDDIIPLLKNNSDRIAATTFNTKLRAYMAGNGIKRKSKSKSKPVIKGVNVREVPPLMKFGKVYFPAS